MKKITLLLLVGLLTLGVNEANAQIKLGAGLFYNTDAEKLGINARGTIGVTENIDVAASLDWHFPEKEFGITANLTGVNADLHYLIFERNASFSPYGLAGLNMLFSKLKGGGFSSNDSYFGANVGAGFELAITTALNLFVEGKYLIVFEDGVGNTIFFSAGVNYPL